MRKSWVFVAAALGGYLNTAEAGETLALVEKVVSETTVDIGPKGDSMGDVLVFANLLFDVSATTKVGTDQGYCVRVIVGKSWECTWTAQLKDGQITTTGPINDNADSVLAIVGGTGRYAAAKGILQVHSRNDSSYDFQYQLQ